MFEEQTLFQEPRDQERAKKKENDVQVGRGNELLNREQPKQQDEHDGE